jgi:hypothetical protein
VKEELFGMVRRSAIFEGPNPAISSAAVTNTSERLGGPSVRNGPSPGMTRAKVVGTSFTAASAPPVATPLAAVPETGPAASTAPTIADFGTKAEAHPPSNVNRPVPLSIAVGSPLSYRGSDHI